VSRKIFHHARMQAVIVGADSRRVRGRNARVGIFWLGPARRDLTRSARAIVGAAKCPLAWPRHSNAVLDDLAAFPAHGFIGL
jgi:hypothetical protein